MKIRVRFERKRIFVGCQGKSERSYGVFLHRLVADEGRLHIDAVPLQPGAGDPLATVQQALKILAHRERLNSPYHRRFILLDRDQWGQCPERDCKVDRLALSGKLTLVWQIPSHEGLLLRHIAGYETMQPHSTDAAIACLKAIWPDYVKGAPAAYYLSKLGIEDIKRACVRQAGLAQFLNEIDYFSVRRLHKM